MSLFKSCIANIRICIFFPDLFLNVRRPEMPECARAVFILPESVDCAVPQITTQAGPDGQVLLFLKWLSVSYQVVINSWLVPVYTFVRVWMKAE